MKTPDMYLASPDFDDQECGHWSAGSSAQSQKLQPMCQPGLGSHLRTVCSPRLTGLG